MTTATDVDVLERLDFQHELPCEGEKGRCHATATFVVRGHCTGCGRRDVWTMCTPCKNYLVELVFDDRAGDAYCPARALFALDSVEPLR